MYIYICVYVCMYVCMYLCMYVFVCVCLCICVCYRVCVQHTWQRVSFMLACACVCACVFKRAPERACVCVLYVMRVLVYDHPIAFVYMSVRQLAKLQTKLPITQITFMNVCYINI